MRLIAFGILAAMLGAGCALEAGDPGAASGVSTQLPSSASPRILLGNSPQGVASAAPIDNPEPAPWAPGDPVVSMDDQSGGNNDNPEPSPWHPLNPVEQTSAGDPTQQQGGGSPGTSSGNSTSVAPVGPRHLVGHWDGRSSEQ